MVLGYLSGAVLRASWDENCMHIESEALHMVALNTPK